jgi:hypothetical protein
LKAFLEGQSCLLSGGTPKNHCSCPVRDFFPFLAQPTIENLWQLAHRTLSGAHRTVRCPLPTVGAGHTSPADLAADHCSARPLVHRTVRCTTGQSGAPPDSPVNYSRTPPKTPESGQFAGSQPGAPDSPVCQTELSLGCSSQVLFFFSFL